MSVRDCYSCAHSPRWEGPHTIAGCAAVDPEGPDPMVSLSCSPALLTRIEVTLQDGSVAG